MHSSSNSSSHTLPLILFPPHAVPVNPSAHTPLFLCSSSHAVPLTLFLSYSYSHTLLTLFLSCFFLSHCSSQGRFSSHTVPLILFLSNPFQSQSSSHNLPLHGCSFKLFISHSSFHALPLTLFLTCCCFYTLPLMLVFSRCSYKLFISHCSFPALPLMLFLSHSSSHIFSGNLLVFCEVGTAEYEAIRIKVRNRCVITAWALS